MRVEIFSSQNLSNGSGASSTAGSLIAFTPSADDASVGSSDGSTGGGAPIPSESTGGTPQQPSLASIDSFDGSFPWLPAIPTRALVPSNPFAPFTPLPSIEAAPLAEHLAPQGSLDRGRTRRSPESTSPSISVSPPPSTTVSSGDISARPIRTPGSPSQTHGRSPDVDGGSTAVDVAMSRVRLDSSASNEHTSTSSPGQDTPTTPTAGELSESSGELSFPRIASPTATEAEMLVSPSDNGRDAGPTNASHATIHNTSARSSVLSSPGAMTPASSDAPSSISLQVNAREATPEVFDLAAIQTALNEDVSRPSFTPHPSEERQHLSPTPTPELREISNRRRRSSSAIQQRRHEVSDEEPPENRFHQPEFQQAFGEAKQLMADLSNVLASNHLHSEPDSAMRTLYHDARELSAFRCPETRTVGFVGDSGVGKSSLINSLLDMRGLARTSANGRACTCVVTEYCYRAEHGFGLEVEYFTREELASQISELLESYRHFHLAEGLDADEFRVFGERADLAEHTFRAMFRAHRQNLEDYLLADEEEEAVLQTLMSWLDGTPRSAMVDETFENLEPCSERLTELTSDSDDLNEIALWPFIRKFRVHCNALILSKGLILVDLPGLRDTNAARRNITERYILNCDEIFAVCNIIRAVTDEGVQAVIELANRASLANVGIICTRSDDIRVDEARRDGRGQLSGSIAAFQSRLAAAQQDLQTIREDLEYYDELDEDDFLEGERDAYIRLRRRETNAKRVVEDREFELKSFLIRTRNDDVRQQLREVYAEQIPGGDLSVFCVSNVDYWRYRNLPRDVSRRHLELSGMMEVRRHCISIVAESQLRAATLYMERRIPALLESLQLWVQSGSGSLTAERRAAIRDTLDDAERILRMGLIRRDSDLTAVRDIFRSFLAKYDGMETWVAGAAGAAGDWSTWHHASYAAFCRNFGDHSTAVIGTRNWNEEAIASMVLSLSPEWRRLCRRIESQRMDAINVLDTLCEEVIGLLRSEEAFDDDQVDTLTHSIGTQQSLLEARLQELYNGLRSDLAHLRTDVLSGIRTSFISQAMKESYRACNRESGAGSDARRKAIINRRLRGEDIFAEMEMRLEARFNAIARELNEEQVQAMRAHFQAIKENLDMLRDENIIAEAESDAEFRGRVGEEINEARNRLNRLLAAL